LLRLAQGAIQRVRLRQAVLVHTPAKPMNGNEVAEDLTRISRSEIAKTALTKEELQNLLFEHIGLSKRECRDMVNAIFEEMRAALEAGESVKLEGFGRFQPRERPKRWARNLQSGEKIAISERRVVTFHPSKKLVMSILQQAAGSTSERVS
jgi:integration host factor subunit alpha